MGHGRIFIHRDISDLCGCVHYFVFPVKHADHHFLLSGDTDGAILLWQLSLADKKVHFLSHIFSIFCCRKGKRVVFVVTL